MDRNSAVDERQLILLNELIAQNNTNMQQIINVYSNNQTIINNYMSLLYRPNPQTSPQSPFSSVPNTTSLISLLLNPGFIVNDSNQSERPNYRIVKYSDISESEIENVDIIEYDSFSHIENPVNDYCVISRESLEGNNEPIYQINSCKHNFKKSLLQRWINMGSNTCPHCRAIIRDD
jgi:hypothetical protein